MSRPAFFKPPLCAELGLRRFREEIREINRRVVSDVRAGPCARDLLARLTEGEQSVVRSTPTKSLLAPSSPGNRMIGQPRAV
jgi:hypothetical protein